MAIFWIAICLKYQPTTNCFCLEFVLSLIFNPKIKLGQILRFFILKTKSTVEGQRVCLEFLLNTTTMQECWRYFASFPQAYLLRNFLSLVVSLFSLLHSYFLHCIIRWISSSRSPAYFNRQSPQHCSIQFKRKLFFNLICYPN